MTKPVPQRCAFVIGTRPEAIKLAPVILAMRSRPSEFLPLLWLTGQHRDMLAQVLDVFGLVADADFALMQTDQSQSELVGKILQRLAPLLAQERPDWLLVQGDTGSALAGALAAYYAGVAVAHVEAGLRTYDLAAPFPEEGNRQMISRIARLHCAPTAHAFGQLVREQVPAAHIVQSGNTVVDAIRWVAKRHTAVPVLPGAWDEKCRMVLVTLHRRESFGSTMAGMLQAIRALADDASLNLVFVFPVHPNPHVATMVHSLLGGHERIALLAPLDYAALTAVLSKCWLVLTDSGGLQEEAPSLHKPVLVLRDVTERPEGIETGAALLVGTDPKNIDGHVRRLVSEPVLYDRMQRAENPYGDGQASQRILEGILSARPRSNAPTAEAQR